MAVVKSLMCTYALVFCSLVAGCTASDWVNVAGGAMQGRDDLSSNEALKITVLIFLCEVSTSLGSFHAHAMSFPLLWSFAVLDSGDGDQ